MLIKILLYVLNKIGYNCIMPSPKFEEGDSVTVYQADVVWQVVGNNLYSLHNSKIQPTYLLKSGGNYITARQDTLTRKINVGIIE